MSWARRHRCPASVVRFGRRHPDPVHRDAAAGDQETCPARSSSAGKPASLARAVMRPPTRTGVRGRRRSACQECPRRHARCNSGGEPRSFPIHLKTSFAKIVLRCSPISSIAGHGEFRPRPPAGPLHSAREAGHDIPELPEFNPFDELPSRRCANVQNQVARPGATLGIPVTGSALTRSSKGYGSGPGYTFQRCRRWRATGLSADHEHPAQDIEETAVRVTRDAK